MNWRFVLRITVTVLAIVGATIVGIFAAEYIVSEHIFNGDTKEPRIIKQNGSLVSHIDSGEGLGVDLRLHLSATPGEAGVSEVYVYRNGSQEEHTTLTPRQTMVKFTDLEWALKPPGVTYEIVFVDGSNRPVGTVVVRTERVKINTTSSEVAS